MDAIKLDPTVAHWIIKQAVLRGPLNSNPIKERVGMA